MLESLLSLLVTADHMVLATLFIFSLIVILLIMSSNCVQIQIDRILDQHLWIKKVERDCVL